MMQHALRISLKVIEMFKIPNNVVLAFSLLDKEECESVRSGAMYKHKKTSN